MMRKLVTLIEIFILFLLQTTLFPAIPFVSVVPNLLLILTVCLAFIRGSVSGLFTGFFCGLMIDLFYGNIFGFYALVYMYIGYFNGKLENIFYEDDVKIPMFLVTVSDLLYGILIWGTQFLLRGRTDFSYYLGHIIIPEAVFTALVTLLLYRLLYTLECELSAGEKGGEKLPWLGK